MTGDKQTAVSVTGLSKSFRNGEEALPIIRSLDLSLEAGTIAMITGESGAGKSTLLNILGGLDSADSGVIEVGDYRIDRLEEWELTEYRRNHIGIVFQFHYLLKDFTALENVMLPALMNGRGRKEAAERASFLLEEVGMTPRLSHYPAQLSGGERQRVALARSLTNDPVLLLADEPTGNLDERNSRIVEDIFLDLVRELGKTLLVVTHDTDLAARGGVRYHLHKGGLERC